MHIPTRSRRPRIRAATALAVALVVVTGLLAGCSSSSSSGRAQLTWYINPDGGGSDPTKGGQAQLAAECSTSAYKIGIQLLPNSASDQRTQLLRRLAAGDSSMDLMSIDPVFVAEFAEAGYLAPVPSSMQSGFEADRVASAVAASKWQGKLVAVPFWANTQLLWYRKSVAQKAGLDMSKPVTWDQLIAAAQKTKTDIGVQALLYEGYTVWINALIRGAGGQIVDNPGATYDQLRLGVNSQAGDDAAAVIAKRTAPQLMEAQASKARHWASRASRPSARNPATAERRNGSARLSAHTADAARPTAIDWSGPGMPTGDICPIRAMTSRPRWTGSMSASAARRCGSSAGTASRSTKADTCRRVPSSS